MSKLTIEYHDDDKWFVEWIRLSKIEKRIIQKHLCEVLFDRIRPKWKVGIVYQEEQLSEYQTSPREVQWINFMTWQSLEENQYGPFGYHLFSHRMPVSGILLETLDQSKQFISLMEQHFTFYALQGNYA